MASEAPTARQHYSDGLGFLSDSNLTPPSARCTCCPYGCHIDTDFINYAEFVASGKDRDPQYHKVARDRSAPPRSQPRNDNASARTQRTSTENRDLFSPIESVFSDSLEEIMSDFEEAYQRTTNTLARLQNGAKMQTQQERRSQVTRPHQSGNMKTIERERMYREQHGLDIRSQRFYPTAESLSTRHRTLRTPRGYDTLDGYHSDVPVRPNTLFMRPASATPLNNNTQQSSSPMTSTLDRKPTVDEYQSVQQKFNLFQTPKVGSNAPASAVLLRSTSRQSLTPQSPQPTLSTIYNSTTRISKTQHEEMHITKSTATAKKAVPPPAPKQPQQEELQPPAPPKRVDSIDRVKRSSESNKKTPPPVPPKPSSQRETPALGRTPSATGLNTEGFQSIRRSSSRQGLNVTSPEPESIYSDVESTTNNTSIPGMDKTKHAQRLQADARAEKRFASMRRSRQMLQGISTRPDTSMSDTEDYTFNSLPRGAPEILHLPTPNVHSQSTYSIDRTAYQQPIAIIPLYGPRAASTTNVGTSTNGTPLTNDAQQYESNSAFFKDQVNEWRRQFQAATMGSQISIGATPFVIGGVAAHKTHQSTLTELIPKCDVGIGVALDAPVVATTTTLQMSVTKCEICEQRKSMENKITIGVNTTEEEKSCENCTVLQQELEAKSKRSVYFAKSISTEGSGLIELPSAGTNTVRVRTVDMESTARIPEPKPASDEVAIQTDKATSFTIGTVTDPPPIEHTACNTENAALIEQSVNTDDVLVINADEAPTVDHSAAQTDNEMTGYKEPCSTADANTETDLDLDSILTRLELANVRPTVHTVACMTDKGQPRDKCVNTMVVKRADIEINTDVIEEPKKETRDQHLETERVIIKEEVEMRNAGTVMEKQATRNVYASTDAAPEMVARYAATELCTCDIATEIDEDLEPEVQEQVVTESAQPSEVPKCDMQTQTEEEEVPHTPREISRQDLVIDQDDKDDVVWLMPEENKAETVDTGIGDRSVYEEPECATCTAKADVHYATTGVGNYNLDDEVTVRVLCPQCDASVDSRKNSAEKTDVQEAPLSPEIDSRTVILSDDDDQNREEQTHSVSSPDSGAHDIGTPSVEQTPLVEERIEERKEEEVNVGRKIDITKPRSTRAFELSRAAAMKKLLTQEQDKEPFQRATNTTRSLRIASRRGDSLQYIADRNSGSRTQTQSGRNSNAEPKKGAGLKGSIIVKKEAQSKLPAQPVPAKIPRPKVVKYAPPKPQHETEEEAAESIDSIAPLRSEMRPSRREPIWKRQTPQQQRKQQRSAPEEPTQDYSSESDTSDTEGVYDTQTQPNMDGTNMQASGSQSSIVTEFEMTPPLKEACDIQHAVLNFNEVDFTDEKKLWSRQYLQHEWLRLSARRNSDAHVVEQFMDALEAYDRTLLAYVVNTKDGNGNTALHYAVSHGNYNIVSCLLDSKVAPLNAMNRAGYTPVMLASLCQIENDEVAKIVVQRLFQMGDVNVRASQHGQTALMLAVSHGKLETSKLLVQCGAGINMQDEDGSTALMCACEHGHKHIVRWMLSLPDIDASLADFDGSTALSIAVENGHRDIGVLIYAHLNYGRSHKSDAGTIAEPIVENESEEAAC